MFGGYESYRPFLADFGGGNNKLKNINQQAIFSMDSIGFSVLTGHDGQFSPQCW